MKKNITKQFGADVAISLYNWTVRCTGRSMGGYSTINQP